MTHTVHYMGQPAYTIGETHQTMASMANWAQPDLAAVARTHANSRVLSDRTRAYFAALAERGEAVTGSATEASHDAYFEAAASCATRGAQSRDRRSMLADLYALREADLAGKAIGPQVLTYPVVIADEVEGILTVTRGHDGTVTTDLVADLDALG